MWNNYEFFSIRFFYICTNCINNILQTVANIDQFIFTTFVSIRVKGMTTGILATTFFILLVLRHK